MRAICANSANPWAPLPFSQNRCRTLHCWPRSTTRSERARECPSADLEIPGMTGRERQHDLAEIFGMTYEPAPSETSVQVVRKDLSRRVFAAGATIFAEGEVGTIAYILLRGDVFRRACVLDPPGRR